MTAALIVLTGLPGTGKTTLARALAARLDAVYLRIDSIEQALRDSAKPVEVYDHGYLVSWALARDNLAFGRVVIGDSVNPVAFTQDGWRRAAGDAPVIEVLLTCSDPREHRARVETRVNDIPGHTLPTWAEVAARDFTPLRAPDVTLDTAKTSVADCAEAVLAALAGCREKPQA